MAISRGTTLGALAAEALIDLSDPSQTRWKVAYLTGFCNEAFRRLGLKDVFRRTDIHVPEAAQASFTMFAEPHNIFSVEWNGRPLKGRTLAWVQSEYGQEWRSLSGTPEVYLLSANSIQLVPTPGIGGTPLIFAGSPAISEALGGKINGNGYFGAISSGDTIAHFKVGDGEVSNMDASYNLRINYSYIPNPSSDLDPISRRYESALNAYMRYQAFHTSQDNTEIAYAVSAKSDWEDMRDDLEDEADPDSMAMDGSASAVGLDNFL